MTLPLGDAMSPDGLIGRLGRALAEAQQAPAEIEQLREATSPVIPEAPVLQIAPASSYLAVLEAAENNETDLDTDHETADAIPMAGRLRPAIPAE